MALSDKAEAALIKSHHRIIDGLAEYVVQEATMARVIASTASLVGRHALFARVRDSRDPQAAAVALLGPVAALEPRAAHVLLQRHEAALSKQLGNMDLVLEALRSVQARTILLLRDTEERTAVAASSAASARREPVPLRAGSASALRPITLAFLHGSARRARLALVADLLHKAAVVARTKLLMAAYLRDGSGVTSDSSPKPAAQLSASALLPALERCLAQACTLAAACGAGALDRAGVDEALAEEHVYGPAAAEAAAGTVDGAGIHLARASIREPGAARALSAASSTAEEGRNSADEGRRDSADDVAESSGLRSGRPAPVAVTVDERSDHAVLTFISPRHHHHSDDARGGAGTSSSGAGRGSSSEEDREAAAGQAALAGAAGATLSHVLSCWGPVVDDAWLFAQRRIVEADEDDEDEEEGNEDGLGEHAAPDTAAEPDSAAGGAESGSRSRSSISASAAGTPKRPGSP